MAFRNTRSAVIAYAEIHGLPMDKKVTFKIPKNVDMASSGSEKDNLASASTKEDHIGSTESKDNNTATAIPEKDSRISPALQDHNIIAVVVPDEDNQTSTVFQQENSVAKIYEDNCALVVPDENNPVSTDLQEKNLNPADAGIDNLAFIQDDSTPVKKNYEVVLDIQAVSAAVVSKNHSVLAAPEEKPLASQDNNIASAVADQDNSAFNKENTTIPPERKDEVAVNMSEPGNQQFKDVPKTPTKTRRVQLVPGWDKNTQCVFITMILGFLVWAAIFFSLLPSNGGKGPLK